MTPQEANAVLAYAVAADSRLGSADAEQATTRAQVWADLLSPVEAQFALDHVRRYYARHHDWPLTPGAVRDAWTSHVRAEEARERACALPVGGTHRPGLTEAGEAARAAVRAAAAAAAEVGPPERSPARPMRYVADSVFQGGA